MDHYFFEGGWEAGQVAETNFFNSPLCMAFLMNNSQMWLYSRCSTFFPWLHPCPRHKEIIVCPSVLKSNILESAVSGV